VKPDPTHRAVLAIKFGKDKYVQIGELLTLTDDQAAELGDAVKPHSPSVAELTPEQLIKVAEAKQHEAEIQRMLADHPAYTSQIEETRISGSPLHLVAANIAEQEAAK
jgi:hypothetical protein